MTLYGERDGGVRPVGSGDVVENMHLEVVRAGAKRIAPPG